MHFEVISSREEDKQDSHTHFSQVSSSVWFEFTHLTT